jgi:NAD(P)H-hydrate epimerase
MAVKNQVRSLQHIVVTADQMRQIEERVFTAGMPVPALMEKVAGRITQHIEASFLGRSGLRVGVLVGPGHNGGDALVVARELHFKGCQVVIYQPIAKLKELTGRHAQYCSSLGIPTVQQIAVLQECDLLIDGLFGFGLERSLSDDIANAVDQINQWHKPVVSIDLPSGLHTDTGQALGTAIQATHTLCLGLWKQGLLQDQALAYVGQAELVDFDLPLADIHAVLGDNPPVQRITSENAIAHLPLPRSLTAHKYTAGHLLLICGSRRYAGAAILSGLGARASGVGMLSIAVPASLQPVLMAQLPEALVIGCPETESGAILYLPDEVQLDKYSAIACGPGLTMEAKPAVRSALGSNRPVVLDADGLNMLADWGTEPKGDKGRFLETRTAPTILTPHPGEFKRLFPRLAEDLQCRVTAVREAAAQTGAIVLLKGARVAISDSHTVWINPASTPALARGGSGDVLTGLIGGLLAQEIAQQKIESPIPNPQSPIPELVQAATWWHSQAGILAAQERTELGVDAHTLTQYLIPALRTHL